MTAPAPQQAVDPAQERAVWLTTTEVAARAGRHVITVRRALESGELHGHQRKPGGPWRVLAEAVDAWIRGIDGRGACGCSKVVRLRPRA